MANEPENQIPTYQFPRERRFDKRGIVDYAPFILYDSGRWNFLGA